MLVTQLSTIKEKLPYNIFIYEYTEKIYENMVNTFGEPLFVFQYNAHIWEHELIVLNENGVWFLNFLVIHFKNEDDMILYKMKFQ